MGAYGTADAEEKHYKKEIIVTLKLELMNIWKKTKNLIYTNIYTIMKSVSQVLIQSVFPC